ncbi:MAG: hypothetical protein C4539_17490 [Ignavibacteriales bacterium]|nr:MAG: hypothetical protein C4539_17490 [Ignavibacteriales bacterium]
MKWCYTKGGRLDTLRRLENKVTQETLKNSFRVIIWYGHTFGINDHKNIRVSIILTKHEDPSNQLFKILKYSLTIKKIFEKL